MTPRERLEGIRAELATYVGHRTHGLLSELIDIVAGLLPDEPAPADEVDLPQRFTDRDGDVIEVGRDNMGALIVIEHNSSATIARLEADDVDRFVAAVLKAAGR